MCTTQAQIQFYRFYIHTKITAGKEKSAVPTLKHAATKRTLVHAVHQVKKESNVASWTLSILI